jgi:fibronectin-binding autotransporter adhesin
VIVSWRDAGIVGPNEDQRQPTSGWVGSVDSRTVTHCSAAERERTAMPAARSRILTLVPAAFALAIALVCFVGCASAQVVGRGNGPPIIAIFETASSLGAVQTLGRDRQGAIVTNRVLASILGGFNEQINCTTCISAFGEIGSFSAGVHGRHAITDDLSVLGGIAYSNYRRGEVQVASVPLGAGSLRYDFTELGISRPYIEAGGVVAPGGRTNFTRHYAVGAADFSGFASATTANYGAFGRAGWVYRFSPRDEASVGAELSHYWQRVGAYSETFSPINPVPLVNGGGTDQTNIARFGGQLTHLWSPTIETQANLGIARSFGSRSGLNATLAGASVTPALGEHTWAEYGARIGYRIQPNVILDAFADGTLGPAPIGNTVHGGVAVRYTF